MAMTKRRFMTPEEFTDEDLGELPPRVRFLALVLRMWADDEGRARLNFQSIKGGAFANDDSTTPESLMEDVIALEAAGFMQSWIADGKQFYAISHRFHTPPEKPRASLLPPPPPPLDASGSDPDGVRVEEEGERERREDRRGPRFSPSPDPETPPMFCPDHMPAGSRGVPCVECRDARMVHEAWLRAQRSRATEDGGSSEE